MQIDLFQHQPVVRSEPMHYPQHPGWQKTDTSFQAAVDMKPRKQRLQDIVMDCLSFNPQGLTTEEVCERTGQDYKALQPRFSELRAEGKITDSGKRRKGASGKNIIVWQAVKEKSDGVL